MIPMQYKAPEITINSQSIDGLVEGIIANLDRHETATLEFLLARVSPLGLALFDEIERRKGQKVDV